MCSQNFLKSKFGFFLFARATKKYQYFKYGRMQIPNAGENDIIQDLYCVCLIKKFINLRKNVYNMT